MPRLILFSLLVTTLLLGTGCQQPIQPNEPNQSVLSQATLSPGEDLFSRHCASCHTVSGDTLLSFSHLRTQTHVLDTPQGFQQFLRVNSTPETRSMPTFDIDRLSDADIKTLFNWINSQVPSP